MCQMQRRAITLIELLVVVGIIGILVALSLVGIQRSRESARNIGCKSRLSQIGIAIQNYESANRVLPDQIWHLEILKFIGLVTEYEQLANKTFVGTIPEYLCPSDNATRPNEMVYSNFHGNCGVWPNKDGYNGVLGIGSWPNASRNSGPISLSDIGDGLSLTALVAEALTGSTTTGPEARLRWVWVLPGHAYTIDEFDDIVEACMSIPQNPAKAGWIGGSGERGGIYSTVSHTARAGVTVNIYNHAAPPQSPSCTNAGGYPTGIASATSNHLSGLNVLFCDGHVEAVNNRVELDVWRQFGDRDGSYIQ